MVIIVSIIIFEIIIHIIAKISEVPGDPFITPTKHFLHHVFRAPIIYVMSVASLM